MSELMNAQKAYRNVQWQLLATVSIIALSGNSLLMAEAIAGDGVDKPTVWIELGGQLEHVGDGEEIYSPPFIAANLDAPYNVQSPLSAERQSRYSFGGEGKISFTPKDADWTLTAGIRYGRSNRSQHLHQQTSTRARYFINFYGSTYLTQHYGLPKGYHTADRFSDEQVKRSASHAILDFMAGKDVGLGLFGKHSTSVLGLGVRYAQFSSKISATFNSHPTQYTARVFFHEKSLDRHRSYYAYGNFTQNFHGIGPLVSLAGSTPVAGDADTAQLTMNWGVNVAVLFGRQKVRGTHETTSFYAHGKHYTNSPVSTSHYVNIAPPINRSRSVTVPNIGGFAGLSFNFPNAKVCLGYRADFFFGAMDGGIDARKTYDRDFFGPYVKVGVGF